MALIRAVLTRGVERGEFRPIDLDGALPLFFAPLLLLLLWKHSLGRHTDIQFNPSAVVATHLDVLLRGLAAPPAPMKRPLVLSSVLGAAAVVAGCRGSA